MKIRPNADYELLGTDIVLDKDRVYDAIAATNQPEYEECKKIFVINIPGKNPDDGFLLERGEYEIVETEKNRLDLTEYTDRTDANPYISLFDQGAIRNPRTGRTLFPLIPYDRDELCPENDSDYDVSSENVRSVIISFKDVETALEEVGDRYFDFISSTRDTELVRLNNDYLTCHIQALGDWGYGF